MDMIELSNKIKYPVLRQWRYSAYRPGFSPKVAVFPFVRTVRYVYLEYLVVR